MSRITTAFKAAALAVLAVSGVSASASANPPLAALCDGSQALNLDGYVGFYRAVLLDGYVVGEDGLVPPMWPEFIPIQIMRYGPDTLVISGIGDDGSGPSIPLYDTDGVSWAYAESWTDGPADGALSVADVVSMTGCEPIDLQHVLAGSANIAMDGSVIQMTVSFLPGGSGAMYGHAYFHATTPAGHPYQGFFNVELVPWG